MLKTCTAARATPARAPARAWRAMRLDVEALYRQYGDMVLGRCRTLLRNEADAQETCQEVFLRLHRYRRSFRGEASPTTYLFRVTTTTCLNRLRTRRRRPEEPIDEVLMIPVEDTYLSNHAVRDLTRRVLSTADPRTQSCVIYHFVDGMTHKEVGAIMGLSAAAVRKRIAKFRAGIRDAPPDWLKEVV